MDELFGITEYKDDIICFHIFEDLYKHKLISKCIDHKIEFIDKLMIMRKSHLLEL